MSDRVVEAFNADGRACFFNLVGTDLLPPGWSPIRSVWEGSASYGQNYLNDRNSPRPGVAKPFKNNTSSTQSIPAQDVATGDKKLFLLEAGQRLPRGWRFVEAIDDWHATPLTVGDDGAVESEIDSAIRRARWELVASNRMKPDPFQVQCAKVAYDLAVEAMDKAKAELDRVQSDYDRELASMSLT